MAEVIRSTGPGHPRTGANSTPQSDPVEVRVKTVLPLAEQSKEYLKVSNHLFRHVMPTLNPTDFVTLCFFMDQTIGRQKKSVRLTYPEIEEGTGHGSSRTVRSSVARLEEQGLLLVRRGETIWAGCLYAVNQKYSVTIDEEATLQSEVIASNPTLQSEVDATFPSKVDATFPSKVGLPDSCKDMGKDSTPKTNVPTSSTPATPLPDGPHDGGEKGRRTPSEATETTDSEPHVDGGSHPSTSLNGSAPPTPSPAAWRKAQFERIWDAWPKHPNKRKYDLGLRRFTELSPTPELVEEILAAIERAKGGVQWCKENGRYVPIPANWLEEKGWKDVVVPWTEADALFSNRTGQHNVAVARQMEERHRETGSYFSGQLPKRRQP